MSFLVLGSRGLVGSAICRELKFRGIEHIAATRQMFDITKPEEIDDFFGSMKPTVVISAAAKVGGLLANYKFPVEFLSENILSQTYLMEAAHKHNVEKFVFLGSSCIYPRDTKQPINEDSLLTGPLEVTNEAYAIAKISGVKLVQSYRREYGRSWISVMPTNLFGPNDNFDLQTSHALPALIRKFHDAKIAGLDFVELWGSGSPRREFMYSDDFASALLHVIDTFDSEIPINIGTGVDVSILELSKLIQRIVAFPGKVLWNKDIPDGTPQKRLDVSRLKSLGWDYARPLESGLESTYEWFKDNYDTARLSVTII